MKEVKVGRQQLLEVLTTNRDAHQKIFDEAVEGYKAKAVELLERALEQARRGERVLERFELPLPVNQRHEYDRAIRMMQMSVESEVTLTVQDFDAYVMDRWHWRQGFLASNKLYSSTAAAYWVGEQGEA